ncbi:EAL domain-containing protein [Stenotrophomonas sp.]|uniref:EAL domain-containing protein n=1 Tax=Stenotrophomonas sp. TaxID=69392 RepID=UPI0028986188|nr:EAL domain-containing protein [Stenotrophomonas sp.]
MSLIRATARRRTVTEAIAIAALVAVALLAGAQAVLYSEDSATSERVAEAVLGRSETITRVRRAVTDEALRVQGVPCSTEELERFKALTFHSSFIADLGRIDGGRLSCSATWGDLAARPLPPPTFHLGSSQVWLSDDLAGTPYAGTTLIARDGVFSVSSTSAFDGIDGLGTSSSTLSIVVDNRAHAIRKLAPRTGDVTRIDSVHSRTCSVQNNVCVVVETPRRSVAGLPPWLLVLLFGLSAFAGAVAACLLARRRSAQHGSIHARLDQAIRQGEIQLVYQPLCRIRDQQLVGFEALSRWHPQAGEDIPPSVFVPIARQFNLTPLLFRHVLAQALLELGPSLRRHPLLYVSVNAEPHDLAQACVVRYLDALLHEAGLRPSQIRIEVTEREQLCEVGKANIGRLEALGYKLLIDDFGTGSANFSHLAESPFHGVKIDRMFVTAITEDSPLRSVLPGMYQIARKLGMDVIIEGIETPEQVALLRELATDAVGQGWHYGYPLPSEDAVVMLG